MQKKLSEIAALLNAELKGDADCIITGVATLHEAKEGDISFFHNPKYKSQLEKTKASAVIISAEMALHSCTSTVIVKDPYFAYAKIAALFAYQANYKPGIHPTAVIGQNCQIDESAYIGPHVVVEDNVVVGANTKIGAQCSIGEGVKIGANCRLDPRVTLYHHVSIGNKVVIFSGAVLGADGFGNAFHEGKWHKVPQLGTVIVEDDVEIGANTTIDRGALGDTIIRQGVRLDNQIQIAHNVEIGANTAIAACVGIAGSAKIGSYCMIAGGVGINGHIEIADQTILTGMAAVNNSIKEKGVYSSGTGLLPTLEWKKSVVRFRQLDKMARRLQQIESLLKGEDK